MTFETAFEFAYNGVPLEVWFNGNYYEGSSELDRLIRDGNSAQECLKELTEQIDYWLVQEEHEIWELSGEGYEVYEPYYSYDHLYSHLHSVEEETLELKPEPLSKDWDDPIPF